MAADPEPASRFIPCTLEFSDGSALTIELRYGPSYNLHVSLSSNVASHAHFLTPHECNEFVRVLKTAAQAAEKAELADEQSKERNLLDQRPRLTRAEFDDYLETMHSSITEEEYNRGATLVECPSEGCNVSRCVGWRFEPNREHV